MIPQSILTFFLGWGQKQIGSDLISRLTSSVSAKIFVFFAIVISAKQFRGEPINCWLPVSFSRSQEEFVEDFCLQSHHYVVPSDEPIPIDLSALIQPGKALYLWFPLLLCMAAALLHLPPLILRFLVQQSGIDIESTMRWAKDVKANNSDPTEFAQFLTSSLQQQQSKWRMSVVFLVVKLLQLATVSFIFVVANLILNGHNFSAGIRFFADLFSHGESPQFFPRVVVCQLKLRAVGDVTNQHSFQCYLTLNILLEKIFAAVWLLLLTLIITNFLSAGYFLFTQLNANHKVDTVKKILTAKRDLSPDSVRLIPSFIRRELGIDGVFLFGMISNSSGLSLAATVLLPMWDKFNFIEAPVGVGHNSGGYRLGGHSNS